GADEGAAPATKAIRTQAVKRLSRNNLLGFILMVIDFCRLLCLALENRQAFQGGQSRGSFARNEVIHRLHQFGAKGLRENTSNAGAVFSLEQAPRNFARRGWLGADRVAAAIASANSHGPLSVTGVQDHARLTILFSH